MFAGESDRTKVDREIQKYVTQKPCTFKLNENMSYDSNFSGTEGRLTVICIANLNYCASMNDMTFI